MLLGHCFKVRSFILAAALISAASLVTHATAQERSYLVDLNSRTVTGLETLSGVSAGGTRSTMPAKWRDFLAQM
jgi:hypothetical protein